MANGNLSKLAGWELIMGERCHPGELFVVWGVQEIIVKIVVVVLLGGKCCRQIELKSFSNGISTRDMVNTIAFY